MQSEKMSEVSILEYKSRDTSKNTNVITTIIPMTCPIKEVKTENNLPKECKQQINMKPDMIQYKMKLAGFKRFADPDSFLKKVDCSSMSVLECINEFLNNKVDKDNKSKRQKYQLLIHHLITIQKDYDIVLRPPVIGEDFFEELELYLLEKGLSPNTIGSLIGSLKYVMKWAALHGAQLSSDIDNYKIRPCDSKPKITLTEDEISRIAWFDINTIPVRKQHKATLTKVRDHFVLSCFLGQRYSDMIRLTEKNFQGAAKDSFKSIQKKTSNQAYLSFHKLYGEYPRPLRKILENYDFQAPFTGHLSNYNNYLHLLCKYIGFDEEIKFEYVDKRKKVVTKTYKKYELISSHTARRSFVTNAIKRNVNVEFVKQASGHISDSSFRKYVILGEE